MSINSVNGVNYSTPTNSVNSSKAKIGPDHYQARLEGAVSFNEAKDGVDYVTKSPNGDLRVTKKNIMGDYGTVYKTDGSVVSIHCPGCGGPQEVLPPGSIDSKIIKEIGNKIQ